MKPICPFCKKEIPFINNAKTFSGTAFPPLQSSILQYKMYVCNLCQAPTRDTLIKELYLWSNFEEAKLLSRALLIDNYYVVIYYSNDLSDKGPSTKIYKDILGTIQSSMEFEPITLKDAVCDLGYVLDLPLYDMVAVKNKLMTLAVFS